MNLLLWLAWLTQEFINLKGRYTRRLLETGLTTTARHQRRPTGNGQSPKNRSGNARGQADHQYG